MKRRIFALFLFCTLLLSCGCGSKSSFEKSDATVLNTVKQNTDTAKAHDEYPYDIAADKKAFDKSNINIVVGSHHYMTQINDWFANFNDYDGKTVEIEGYYMIFKNKYTFVGRKGPTCPYCTGGYVNFEFKTNEDLSKLVSEESWIKVTGILRQGMEYHGGGQKPTPFYYIEAMSVEKMAKAGKGTITD